MLLLEGREIARYRATDEELRARFAAAGLRRRGHSSLGRLLLGLTLATALARLLTLPSVPENTDALFFTRGVLHYSVLDVSPHFPGYPVFIWLAKAASLVTGDPLRGLHVVSALASALTLWFLARTAGALRRWTGGGPGEVRWAALVAGLLWAFSPLAWNTGTEALSDAAGLCVAAAALWWTIRGLEPAPTGRWLVGAAGLAGVTLGVRLADLGLLLPVAYAVWQGRSRPSLRPGRGPSTLAAAVGAFLLAVAVWLGWQWEREGMGLVVAAEKHLAGHYERWGESILTDPDVSSRPWRLLHTVSVVGFAGFWPGEPWPRLLVTLALSALLAAGTWRLVRSPRRAGLLLLLWLVPYAAEVLVNFDLALFRYALPLVAGLVVIAALGLPRKTAGWITGLALAGGLAVTSVPLARRHQQAPRLGYRLTRWMEARLDPARDVILVDPDNRAVSFFLSEGAPGFTSLSVVPPDLTPRGRRFRELGRQVYATMPAPDAPGDWVPVVHFCRADWVDQDGPAELWLFRYAPGETVPPLPGCS